MPPQPVVFLDEFGQPLNARLQVALTTLMPRLRREFRALTDDCTVTEILEESGRRIAAREARRGPLDNLLSYGWVVVRRMAALRLRHDAGAQTGVTVSAQEGDAALAGVVAGSDTSEQIEARILIGQLLAQLTSAEQDLLKAKHRGLSVEEMARLSGSSPLTLFNAWRRLRRKVGGLARESQARPTRPARLDWKKS